MTGEPQYVFLFTDVEGSTRLWEQQAEAMRAAMQWHDDLLRDTVRQHGGSVVKMAGDGIHAVFGDVPSALAAAVNIQCALRNPPSALALTLKVRSAIHAGPAEARDGDYYGPVVNRAARLAAAAHGGQILVSDPARRALGDAPAAAALRLLGVVRLRDLSAAEPVHQVLHDDLQNDFPPLRAMASHPNNLPQSRNTFFGRARQLADIDRQFERARLVTLCGVGGIGKSRLAQHAGARLIDRFPDGVWWIELAPLAAAADVLPALAAVLKLQEARGQTLQQTLLRRLAGQQVLVMLDNCEHVIDEVARLVDGLLRDCPGVRVLATSREPLEIEGEALIQVPPLATPEPEFPSGLQALLEVDAAQLLLDRARLQAPDFQVAETDAALLARVVNRLDGIPLAIELAAACLRTLSLAALDTGLNDRFGLLVAGTRFAPVRHKTLRGLIDWSFDLLSPTEQACFIQIAVFVGSFSVRATAAMLPGALSVDQVAALLDSLADKSLIQKDADGSEYSRYRMLETLRQYALEKLDAAGQLDDTRRRHLAAMAAQMREVPTMDRMSRGAIAAAIKPEFDNLRAALACAQARDDCWQDGLECARVLGDGWYLTGQFTEGRRVLEQVAKRILALESQADTAAIARSPAAARVHYCLGRFYYMRTLAEETELSCSQAERICRALEDYRLLGLVIALRAHNRFVHEGHRASRELYDAAIRLLIEHERDTGIVIQNLCNVANNALYAGEMGDVEHYRAWAQRYAEGRQDLRELSGWRMQSGLVLMAQGDAAAALQEYLAGLDICRGAHDQLGEVQLFMHAGIARWALRDAAGAVRSLKSAFALMRSAHPAIESINTLEALSMVLAESGRVQAAALLLGACERLRLDTGFPAGAQARLIRDRARAALQQSSEADTVPAWLKEGELLGNADLLSMVDAQ